MQLTYIYELINEVIKFSAPVKEVYHPDGLKQYVPAYGCITLQQHQLINIVNAGENKQTMALLNKATFQL